MSNYRSIEEVFEAFKDKTVLVIGDVMIDSYVYGAVKRISPEAPVPVLSVSKREKRLGGAANVAMNIRSLGAIPILCSVVGDDPNGEIFENLLTNEKMPRKGIIRSQNRVTTVKHRILSGPQHLLRVDSEDTHPLTELDRKTLQHHIKDLIDECDLVIFEDYDKGTISDELITETVNYASEKGVPVAVDPKKVNFLSYKKVALFKPNLSELGAGLGMSSLPTDEESLKEAVEKLHNTIQADNYLVTLSEKGILYKGGEKIGVLPAHVRGISDVSGAGDTVVSIAGLAHTLGLPLDVIAELANLGGGIVCESSGVVPIDSKKLLEEAKNNEVITKYFK